jgi:hypothetical protein
MDVNAPFQNSRRAESASAKNNQPGSVGDGNVSVFTTGVLDPDGTIVMVEKNTADACMIQDAQIWVPCLRVQVEMRRIGATTGLDIDVSGNMIEELPVVWNNENDTLAIAANKCKRRHYWDGRDKETNTIRVTTHEVISIIS